MPMKFTTDSSVSATSDMPEMPLDNVPEEISFHHAGQMNNTTTCTKFACANQTTTESMDNVKSQSLVEPTLTGMVSNANAILDTSQSIVNAFS